MKRFACCLLVCALCLLCACAQLSAAAAQTPTPAPVLTPAIIPTPTATPVTTGTPAPSVVSTPMASPTTMPQLYAADVPDVVNPDDEPIINAGRGLYEDEAYIYILSPWYWDENSEDDNSHNGLFRISRANGNAECIARDVSCFTLSGESIYYATYGGAIGYRSLFDTVCRYDTDTGETEQVFERKEDIYRMAVHGGRLYYAADPEPWIEREFYSDLFSCALDGSDRQLVVEEPDSFCIYHGSIYYMSGAYGVDYTPMFQCGLDGSNIEMLADVDTYWWTFEIRSDTLFYIEWDVGLTMQSLDTGDQTVLPDYADFALMGQYAVTIGDKIDAYDFTAGQTYRLAGMQKGWEPYNMRMYSGNGCAYFSVESETAFSLYRLTIENGSAKIVTAAIIDSADILS